MAAPISIGDVIAVVEMAVALYQRIHDQPEEIQRIGQQMEGLSSYLADVDRLITDSTRQYLANLQSRQRFRSVADNIKRDCQDVLEILETWKSTGRLLRVFFSIGRNPTRLSNLMSNIDRNKWELHQILQLQQSLAAPPTASISATNIEVAKSRQDYAIILVDPSNVGRSKVAEGYMKLLQQWTTRTNGTWPVKFAHSAGMGTRSRSDSIDILQSLNCAVPFNDGNKAPNETAVASLFDNKFFNYPYKTGIRNYILLSRSRGINQSIFKTYDYIIVFVGREYRNLIEFKKALIGAKGMSLIPRGKGHIVHLGAFLSKTGKPIEIMDAKKNDDGTHSRANWNTTTSQIKLAIKTFLKEELDWIEPPKGAPQS